MRTRSRSVVPCSCGGSKHALVTVCYAVLCCPALLCAVLSRAALCCAPQVNGERTAIQELQISPMGVIQMIAPNNSDTRSRLGIDIFEEVGPSAPDT